MRRVRKCDECGKPLGSTLGACHECGGDSYRAGGPSEADARAWKLALGVSHTQIESAHDGKFVGRGERL
jgi:hypothetical protein